VTRAVGDGPRGGSHTGKRAGSHTGKRAGSHTGKRAGRRPTESGRHAPRVPFALLVTGLIVGGLALLLALNTASAANELRHQSLDSRDATIANDVPQLQNEVAASAAPANLARAAAELGMVPAGNPAFIVEASDGSATLRGKPEAATAAPLETVPLATPHATPHATATGKAKVTKPPAKKTRKSRSKKTTSPKSSRTPTSSKGPKAPTSTTAGGRRHARKHPASPTPTPTPTPTMTLPGGNR
jgi:hypothetical protein